MLATLLSSDEFASYQKILKKRLEDQYRKLDVLICDSDSDTNENVKKIHAQKAAISELKWIIGIPEMYFEDMAQKHRNDESQEITEKFTDKTRKSRERNWRDRLESLVRVFGG